MDSSERLPGQPESTEEELAERMLEKLRTFIQTQLSAEERALFAVLLAPGVAESTNGLEGQSDVGGFGTDRWEPAPLPVYLARALRRSGIRIITDRG